MRLKLMSVGLGLVLSSGVSFGQEMYKLGSKSISKDKLSPAVKEQLYQIEKEAYLKTVNAITMSFYDDHLKALADKKGKSVEQLEAELFKVKDPTEAELKAWYEENKARIPYPFDQIKDRISSFLNSDKLAKARDEYIDSLKKKEKFKLSLVEPKQPVVEINTAGFATKGNPDAKIKVVEFADYYCPHCKHAFESFEKIMKKYGKKIHFTFMDFPLQGEKSKKIAVGAYCAGKQGKFWQFHTKAFEGQKTLSGDSVGVFAKELKLDESSFNKCLKSDEASKHVDAAQAEGRRIGVGGTPAIYINGKKIAGHHDGEIEKAIERALAGS